MYSSDLTLLVTVLLVAVVIAGERGGGGGPGQHPAWGWWAQWDQVRQCLRLQLSVVGIGQLRGRLRGAQGPDRLGWFGCRRSGVALASVLLRGQQIGAHPGPGGPRRSARVWPGRPGAPDPGDPRSGRRTPLLRGHGGACAAAARP